MRVCLFTDTLGDVNGVSRFIRSVAGLALETGRDLRVVTSTSFDVPRRANILNHRPLAAMRMPGYENLELALPPWRRMLREMARLRPDAVHVSTPGPVGLVGFLAARRLRVPVLGVYHTDFPAYVEHLFADDAATWMASRAMRSLYTRFARVFTRSTEYAAALESLGVRPARIVRLRPGIDTDLFHVRHRDPGVWERVGVPAEGVKVLYCGRVSVEKNLPLLVEVWARVRAELGQSARLVVIGDGPYRAEMERRLSGMGCHFLGFRSGQELSALYASGDLFVFPSTTDTLGQVVMESQCSGLPVLVSDRGGPREVVLEGTTGLVLPAEDAGAWARPIVGLAQDPERRRRMGAAAHGFVRPMTIAASFEHFWSVHEEAVLEAKRATPPASVPGAVPTS